MTDITKRIKTNFSSPLGARGFIKTTPSTNSLLWEMLGKEELPEGFVMCTDFQTEGKGQSGNSWESEPAKNLLFSLLLYPRRIPSDKLFLISQIVSVAIKKALEKYTSDIEVKWPNDIYWRNQKIAGILIENAFQGFKIKTVIGVGLNVNQLTFRSDAPNPVSLCHITGTSINRNHLMSDIIKNIMELYQKFDTELIRSEYADILYRRTGYYPYKTETETFNAKIVAVHPDGKLELETETGERKEFYFKEVQFV